MKLRLINSGRHWNIEIWRWWWPFWTYKESCSSKDWAMSLAEKIKHPEIIKI